MADLILFALLVVLVLLGPLAYLFGADSRLDEPRGGWPGAR